MLTEKRQLALPLGILFFILVVVFCREFTDNNNNSDENYMSAETLAKTAENIEEPIAIAGIKLANEHNLIKNPFSQWKKRFLGSVFFELADKMEYEVRHDDSVQARLLRLVADDAMQSAVSIGNGIGTVFLARRFIIAKPDPLVEAWIEATGNTVGMEPLNAAIEKRGGKIVWGEG